MFESYTEQICLEAESRADEIRQTLELNTLYIGGGTPSVLPLTSLERIVRCLLNITGSRDWDEFTIEVNPEDIVEKGEDYVRGLLRLGVSRISMGVQSLDDGILRWMRRRHSADGARKAFETLRKAGTDNLSADIIFGVPGLSDVALERTVEDILALGPEHISAYQLSIEEGSELAADIAKGVCSELGEENCRMQYELICKALAKAGYHHYEISNWAVSGREAIHNSAYWQRLPYAGLGPGAHSLCRSQAEAADADIRKWNSQALSGWTSDHEKLSEKEISEEKVMLGLRTKSGWSGRILSEKEWFVADSIILDNLQ